MAISISGTAKIDLLELRGGAGIRRPLPSALRRHQPDQGGAGVYRFQSSRDVRWLGSTGGRTFTNASDYFEQHYDWASTYPRRQGHVDDLAGRRDAGDARQSDRARAQQPLPRQVVSRKSRSFRRMREGEFPNGACVLRAKIDMAAGNINPARPGALIASCTRSIRAPELNGVSIRLTTSLMASRTRRGRDAFPVHARIRGHRPLYDWLIEICRCRRGRGNTNSPGSI